MKLKLLLTSVLVASSLLGGQAQSVQSYINDADELYKNGKYDDAIVLALKALEKNPNSYKANWICSVSYYNLEFYSEALRYYKKTIDVEPTVESSYSNLGGIYATLGEDEIAIESLNKAIELNSDYATPQANIAGIHARFGRLDEAFKYSKEALVIDPDEENVHHNLAVMHFQDENNQEADKWMEKTLKIAKDPRRHYQLSEEIKRSLNPKYKYSKAKLNEALAYYTEQFQKNRYDSHNLLRRGECYDKLGEKELARKDYLASLDLVNEVLADVPNTWTKLKSRAEIYNALGKKKEALADFRQVVHLNPHEKESIRKIEELSK